MKVLEKLNISPININLYEQAFTHSSFSNENAGFLNFERLEFLGDAVLEIIISDYLYKEKHLEEGTMTKMRANYVCEKACATYARDLEFEKDIKLGNNEEVNDTIIADVFEAFIGAVYLDKGFEFVNKLIMNIIIKYIEKGINFLLLPVPFPKIIPSTLTTDVNFLLCDGAVSSIISYITLFLTV